MNRTQRRSLDRQQKERTYTFTESQLKKHIMSELDAIKKDAMKSAIEGLMSVTLISLSDEFGFGSKRLNRFIDKLNSQYDSVERGDVTLDDFNAWAIENGINYKIGG